MLWNKCYHWLEEVEEKDMLLRYLRKRPLSAIAFLVLTIWFVVLVYVGLTTIDDFDVQQMMLTTTPPLSVVEKMTEQTVGEEEAFNMDSPLQKREKLLRDWLLAADKRLDQPEIVQENIHNVENEAESKHSRKSMRKLKNVSSNSSNAFVEKNLTLSIRKTNTSLLRHIDLNSLRNDTMNTSSLFNEKISSQKNTNLTEARFKLSKENLSEINNMYKQRVESTNACKYFLKFVVKK